MLGIIDAKIILPPDSLGWAQVYKFIPDDLNQLNLRGKLFVVFSTTKTDGNIDSIVLGREFIGRLQDEYYGTLDGEVFSAIRNAVQKVVTEFSQSWGNLEVSACAFVNEVVYSVASGGGKIMISRDGSLATILESTSEVVTASGYPKEGDSVILATSAFFRKVDINVIKTSLTNNDPEVAVELISQTFQPNLDKGNVGALVMKFTGENSSVQVAVTDQPEEKEKKPERPNIFSNFIKRIPQKNIYIRSGVGDEITSQSKKMTFSIGLILLVILLVSIGFGVRQKKINDLKNKYQGILQVAQSDVDLAISLASVSPDKSRELFTDSELKLQEIQDLKIKDPKVSALQQKINDSRGAILGEYDGTPSLFLDLSLLSSGFNGDTISSSGGQVFILDKSGKRIVSVEIDTKKSKVVAGPSVLSDVEDIASYQGTVYILASDGIYQVDSDKTKVIDKTWSGDSFISAFAGNMYVLDKSGNTIYRYPGQTDNTFGPGQDWLSASTKPNFSSAMSWAMDGAIYVLYPNARILKYSLGSPQNFSLTGIVPDIGNIDAVYADPDNQYIYLLDRAGKRVVVIDKKGNYKAQYTSDQISNAKSLVVSEAQKEIILLTGDKLLSIVIRNL